MLHCDSEERGANQQVYDANSNHYVVYLKRLLRWVIRAWVEKRVVVARRVEKSWHLVDAGNSLSLFLLSSTKRGLPADT